MKTKIRIAAFLLGTLILITASVSAATLASLNQHMITYSGPGTQYTQELGTLPQNTNITLIEMVTINGIPWGMVEFYNNGMKYRAYTLTQYITAYGPIEWGTLDYYEIFLSQSSAVYYGPGYDYARRQKDVPAGAWLRVYDSENGFMLCDYQQDDKWVRGYLPELIWDGSSYQPSASGANVPAYGYTPASLNQRMATRSGPGTKYTEELGTLPKDTSITLIHTVTTDGTPWGMVEFINNGMKYRAYTGMKRIDAYGSVAQGTLNYYEVFLSQNSPVYYGPGYEYARRQKDAPMGKLRIYSNENGFFLCDYEQDGKWARGYLPGWTGNGQFYPSPAQVWDNPYYHTPAALNQRMATRSGPGTQYTEELGTMPQSTQITLIEYVTTSVPWGLVEFYKNGMKVRAYTGMKRIDAYGPVAQGTKDYHEVVLSKSTAVYYGPGYDYAMRKESVEAGTLLRVFGYENGFTLCDYHNGKHWVRAYFPEI